MRDPRLGRFRCFAHEVGSVLHVSLEGELDLDMVLETRASLREPMAGWQRTVVVDLSELTFLDSAGLKFMIDSKREIESRGGRLYLRAPSAVALRVIEVSHLARWFDWVDASGRVTERCEACGSPLAPKARRCGSCGRAT